MLRHTAKFCYPSAPFFDFWIYLSFESAIILVVAMPTVPPATTVASLPAPVAADNVSGAGCHLNPNDFKGFGVVDYHSEFYT